MQNGKIKSLKAANCLPQAHTFLITQSGLRNLTNIGRVADLVGSSSYKTNSINLPLYFAKARLVWEDYTEVYWVFLSKPNHNNEALMTLMAKVSKHLQSD